MRDMPFCDDCGEPITDPSDVYAFAQLPADVASANAGESSLLCGRCYVDCLARAQTGSEDGDA